MAQVIDWEAQMEIIRSKATAAARHSERTVSGVAQCLSELSEHRKAVSALSQSQAEIINCLGSLESAQKARLAPAQTKTTTRTIGIRAALASGLLGILIGGIVAGVFFWS